MSGLVIFLAVTPAAGMLADRLLRLAIIVICQLVCGITQLGPALVLSGTATVGRRPD
ncbi:hypothetical protein [Nonomuraea sp. 10N515B]|uniref:hypothetical protein n=1 Tax=Nonomuraea sp. 10N515B TaxID=3457422 RepID=UPI003FCE027B